ncbi:PREDICTED: lupeol synthase 5-like isoform X2 [Camelina sativa]|uniref:Lupeol synthase 5-like isoform X2 n=1 Tax=Camelina sativa TaxID=90675 RepID=A0ABM1QCT2_CAMSA|nr:PREDICTED: lupeol synthase 5-like isoform X2 [Camelina sativa]
MGWKQRFDCMGALPLYIPGHLKEIFDADYPKEMLRFIYCHQSGDYALRERAFQIVPAEASKILGIFDWSGTIPLLPETAICIYVCRFLWDSLHIFVEPFLARWPLNKLVREKALRVAMEHVNDEDANSNYIARSVMYLMDRCLLCATSSDRPGTGFNVWEGSNRETLG